MTATTNNVETAGVPASESNIFQNLTPESASVIRDFFLDIISTEHKVTRAMIGLVTDDMLDYRPTPKQRSVSDLIWSLAELEHRALAGICNAGFAAENAADHKGAQAVLEWDDQHFDQDFSRLQALSGEELLRTADFAGLTLPVVRYLPLYLGLILQFRAQLSLYLGILAAQAQATADAQPENAMAAAAGAESELSEDELAGVAGGVVIVAHYGGPSPLRPAQTQATLGSLFITSDPKINSIMSILSGAGLIVAGAATAGIGIAGAVANAAAIASIGATTTGTVASMAMSSVVTGAVAATTGGVLSGVGAAINAPSHAVNVVSTVVNR